MRENKVRTLVLYGMFIAVVFLLGLTPMGYIYLPMAAITTVHIPVIVGGYTLGKKGGAVLGFVKGIVYCVLLCWLLSFFGLIIGKKTLDGTTLARFFLTFRFITNGLM